MRRDVPSARDILFVAACSVAVASASSVAVAEKWVTGVGKNVNQAQQQAITNAENLAEQRGTCVIWFPSKDNCGQGKNGVWECKAEVADYKKSCDKSTDHSTRLQKFKKSIGM